MHPTRIACRRALAVGLLLLAGCGRSLAPIDPASDVATRADAGRAREYARACPALDALWPSEDGRNWQYAVRGWTPLPQPGIHYGTRLFDDPGLVPPAPDPQDVLSFLRSKQRASRAHAVEMPSGWAVRSGIYSLTFDGYTVVSPEKTVQNLVEHLSYDADARRARQALARPDRAPLFLHGGAWEKSGTCIGTYRAGPGLPGEAEWKFLGSDLQPGAAFTFPLPSSWGSGATLRGLVVPQALRQRPGAYRGELEVVYVVDYGVVAVEGDPERLAEVEGYWRPVEYGTVVYAPDIGPVEVVEHRGLAPTGQGAGLEGPGFIQERIELALTSVTPGPRHSTAVRP